MTAACRHVVVVVHIRKRFGSLTVLASLVLGSLLRTLRLAKTLRGFLMAYNRTTWLPYQSSLPNSYSRSEVNLLPSKRSTTGSGIHASLTQESHRIMLARQVKFLQPLSTADFTNDVHRPRLTSQPFDVSLRLVRRFLSPRYATVYTTLRPDVFAQIHVLVLFKIQVLRTQCHMTSLASRTPRLKPLN